MTIRIKTILAAAAAVAALGAPAAMAQADLTAYSYVYYADAAKTQVLGEVSDRGCGGRGDNVHVLRAFIPTPYYDATPIYICTSNGPMDPGGW
jgi:microcystin degradation protein MlrC